jgi:hypothetical protein
MLVILEGGYNLRSISSSVAEVMKVISLQWMAYFMLQVLYIARIFLNSIWKWNS